ncbi:MAG: PrsW family intramembrane metalloprotease [Kineosporiaceae bacterium]
MTSSPRDPVRRPALAGRVATWLVAVGIVVGLTAAVLVALATISAVTGTAGLITGVVLAAVPVLPVAAILVWLDRYEAEPAPLLVFAFAWGAGAAALFALVVNTASMSALRAAGGDVTLAAVGVAPLVEETSKALAVVGILLLRRREFDGVVDGIVYAGLAGLGFAFTENVLYLGRTLAESGTSGLAFVFILRCVVSPFAHPLFTAASGIGLGLAARTRHPAARPWLVLGGWAVAVALHSAWNLSASTLRGFLTVYVLVQLPVLAGFAALAVLARRREGRVIARHLAVYVETGWVSPAEVHMLASLAARRHARTWASARGGRAGRAAMRRFQDLGSNLAFLRERVVRGTAGPDAAAEERRMLTELAQARAQLVR